MRDLHARKPINKEAALVTQDGNHEDLNFQPNPQDSELPIPTTQLYNYRHYDFTNTRIGRLTVIGYWGRNDSPHSGTAARHRWVVRCDCGIYSIRREEKIKKRNPKDSCSRCKYISELKSRV